MSKKQWQNIRRAEAIKESNKQRLLKVNPKLDDESGIYILWRTKTVGYIGQSKHLITRLAEHLAGYIQHIDLSLKSHGLYSEKNKGGYKIDFFHCPKEELDQKEREYIQKALDAGWEVRNKTGGGQDEGKEKIADFRPAKGYHDGLKQGRKSLAKELKHIIDTHLLVTIRPEKQNNKVSQKALEKFNMLLNEETYADEKDEKGEKEEC